MHARTLYARAVQNAIQTLPPGGQMVQRQIHIDVQRAQRGLRDVVVVADAMPCCVGLRTRQRGGNGAGCRVGARHA